MITLHRLGHRTEPFHLNHDMIMMVEANPDTVITLQTGDKIVVAERPEEVVHEIRECRIEILAEAMIRRHEERRNRATAGPLNPDGPRLVAVESPAAGQ